MGTPSAGRRWLWVGLIVLVVGHLPTLGAGFVNREWAFAEATRTLLDPAYEEGLHKYCGQQANPLGYSLAAAGLLSATGLPVEFWTVRLPSLAGGCLLLLGGYRLAGARSSAVGRFGLWAAVVLANPLVWCYAGQATADVLPAAIGLWAGAEALRVSNALREAAYVVLGGEAPPVVMSDDMVEEPEDREQRARENATLRERMTTVGAGAWLWGAGSTAEAERTLGPRPRRWALAGMALGGERSGAVWDDVSREGRR